MSFHSTILLISEDARLTRSVESISQGVEGLEFVAVQGIDAAYEYTSWDKVSLVLIHQSDRGSAMQVNRILRMIAAARRPVATIVLGDPYDADQAIALLRMGVADYLGLPLDASRLSYLIEVLTVRSRQPTTGVSESAKVNISNVGRLASLASTPPAVSIGQTKPIPNIPDSGLIVGNTPATQRLVDQIRRVAPGKTTLLLGGETGTGKTRLAQLIHDLSERREEPFMTVNCGQLSGALIESELFGHVQGAFEGADADRLGKLAEVGQGTLFFDGIDSLPLAVQAKLLKVVEDQEFEPIGAMQRQPLKARVIAATNKSLDEEVAEGRFRSDLYYRLNVVAFQLPPLRERRDAIEGLARQFIEEMSRQEGRDAISIGEDALEALLEHDWPGNLRELRNAMSRCVLIRQDGEIRREDLPLSVLEKTPRIAPPAPPIYFSASLGSPASLAQTKGQAELARITEALEKHSNNRLRAAGELGISRMTLYKKLYKYGLMGSPS